MNNIQIKNRLHLTDSVEENLYYISKRITDILVAGTILIALMPLMFFVALLIKLTSKGSILFWQQRVGKDGYIIMFPKFRSMVTNGADLKHEILDISDHYNSIKMKKNPRVTWIGRFIRKARIDELPQLFLVLKGEMSMVGPRPATLDEVSKYTSDEHKRLYVKPGVSCIWQVSGRANIPFDQQVEMDYEYIQNRSLWLDLKLLLLIIPAVLLS